MINVQKLSSWIKFVPQSLFLSPMAKIWIVEMARAASSPVFGLPGKGFETVR